MLPRRGRAGAVPESAGPPAEQPAGQSVPVAPVAPVAGLATADASGPAGGLAPTDSGAELTPADSAVDSAPAAAAAEPPGHGLPMGDWLAGEADVSLLWDLLHEVIDPELGVNIVDLGLVYAVTVEDGQARVRMTMTTPGCPLGAYFDDTVHDSLWGTPGVNSTDVEIIWDPPWSPDMMTDAAKQQLGWPR